MKPFLLLLPALMVAAPVFADKKDGPKFAAGQASSYAAKQRNEDVTIAGRTYDTDELARTAFGNVNPYSYDILPVLVIVQNDTNESLRLDRLRVTYESIDGKRIDATPAADVPYVVEAPRRPNNPVPNPLPIKRKQKNPLGGGESQPRPVPAPNFAPLTPPL